MQSGSLRTRIQIQSESVAATSNVEAMMDITTINIGFA